MAKPPINQINLDTNWANPESTPCILTANDVVLVSPITAPSVEEQVKNGVSSFKKCKCGNDRRKNKSDCLACHREESRKYRVDQRRQINEAIARLDEKLIYVDQNTKQHFDLRIDTVFVEVLTAPPDLDYIALPIGFLTDDRIVVWDDGKINIVTLNQLRSLNNGIKRR